MRSFTLVSALGAVAMATAQSNATSSSSAMAASATRPANVSICDFYAGGLFKVNNATTQFELLTALVNTAVGGNQTVGTTGVAVTGILGNGTYNGVNVSLLQYFDGSLASSNRNNKAVSVNFLDGGGAAPLNKSMAADNMSSNQYFLLTHLYEYFGNLLGCSAYGMNTGFPAYGGDTNMFEVHKFMDLDHNEVSYFIQEVGFAAAFYGVLTSDIEAVGMSLGKLFNYKCLAPVAILPGQANETESICIDDSCPMAPGVTSCNKNYTVSAAVSPAPSNSSNVFTATPTEAPASTGAGGSGGTGTSSTTSSTAGAATYAPVLGFAGIAALVMAM